MPVPAHLRYTVEHEWLHLEDDVATIGITAFAADALGDVVYVGLPPVGTPVVAGEPCGEIESTKSVSELYAPVDGTVVEVNNDLAVNSAMINSDPFGAGWILRVRVVATTDLLDAAAYEALTEGAE